ncbi:GH25 family lysozyme [Limosilactobacillus oris]|uniref:GH25 family lysozyme n=1 Tax=Limosilactobacillus oris TaxID=1632 RepID=UPI0019572F8B|nr:GH25 family lysozyme [Limosilactobacillus oris]VTX85056.1 Glycosyl hydrolases family 25 [Limosilactobacillus oris]
MANRLEFLDVSGYQPNAQNRAFWDEAKRLGVAGAIIKTTEGTYYRNPYGWNQVAAARLAGMKVAAYHFAKFVGNSYQAVNEANYAIATANSMGLPHGSIIVLDYEERAGIRAYNTQACIAFCKTIKAAGFVPAFYSYSGMANLWDYEAIRQATGAKFWVAAYPRLGPAYSPDYGSFPSISAYIDGWQYTDNWRGWGVDGSVDLTGVFTTTEKVTSGGHLDDCHFEDGKLVVAGWFASDKASGKGNHYVIITDDQGHEFARQSVALSPRPDVAKAFPDIPEAGQSGFAAKFDYTADMAGKKLRVYFRYTDDPAGNGNAVDYTSLADLSKSAAYLDDMNVSFGKKLHVAGWFASDLSIGKPNRFVILFDAAANRELQRVKVDSAARPDVAKAQPAIYGAGQSGFNAAFDYDASLVGHKLQIIARYSDEEHGEGKYVDYWFDPFNGPSMPVLDGKTEQTFVAHDIKVESQQNGTLLVNAK